MKNVLIYYRYFGMTLGGGEFLPLTAIAYLQQYCNITLALDWTDHFDRAIRFLDIPIDRNRLKLVKVMPKNYHGNNNGAFLSLWRFRKLKKLAKTADVCISFANVMDFGKPAHHFLITIDLGDKAFSDYVKTRCNPQAGSRCSLRTTADVIFRRLFGMKTKREIICNPLSHIYPNSNYVATLLHGFYGNINSMTFYPPTIFKCQPCKTERNPLKVIYLGRVSLEKRILDIIKIVERARSLSKKNITLSIAGRLHLGSEVFKNELESLTSGKDWIEFPGEMYGEEKTAFLLSGTYAIHALREEAFGISITEYLKAGLVPIVPDEGGSCEVVDNKELTYHTNAEAAEILVRLLNDAAFRKRQQDYCSERAKLFSAEAYMKRQNDLMEEIIGK